ncbi:hypothetical protein MPLA_1530016 [Mesorhizobium sp. ORS 3359]|nr:hypothetical protein MPLA_1530016 [Mesorhizobium sp. ORS 3359]
MTLRAAGQIGRRSSVKGYRSPSTIAEPCQQAGSQILMRLLSFRLTMTHVELQVRGHPKRAVAG